MRWQNSGRIWYKRNDHFREDKTRRNTNVKKQNALSEIRKKKKLLKNKDKKELRENNKY